MHLGDMVEFMCDTSFDGIFAIESICHIADKSILFKNLNLLLRDNGKLVVSDYFYREDSFIKDDIDSRWKTNLSTVKELTDIAEKAGFTLCRDTDLTDKQIPFWELSQHYSELKVTEEIADSEKDRLKGSRAFHARLVKRFNKKDLQYIWIVFTNHRKN